MSSTRLGHTLNRITNATMASTSSSSKRRHPPRHDFSSNNNNNNNRQSQPRPPKRRPGAPQHHLNLDISWLAHQPPIEGLDPSIVVQPRRLHFTLGVMTLNSSPNDRGHDHDLASATTLLDNLVPSIRTMLANNPLRVPLDCSRLKVMQPDPTRAHVLYLEPDSRSSDGLRLRAVCDLVYNAFNQAGLLNDGNRPLKLHCTLLNTRHRRPQQPGQRRSAGRIPFSFSAFPQGTVDNLNLGTWTVDELQICEMGSWTPDGAYVRVAGCDLRPGPAT
ncbi:AKAP7 2'5' RNA ligase-like domain-containing protein [Lactifluus volemus]|nr:AKAP7 2'5' RNA ligase-like domain-containing protein [Lactifluus volemus]